MTPSQAKNAIRRSLVEIIDPKPKKAEIEAMWNHFENNCAFCGTKMNREDRVGHADHLLAASAGGRNHIYNRVLACPKCNGDVKLDLEWRKFMDDLPLTKEARDLRIRKIEEWQELHREGCFVSDEDVAAALTAAEITITEFERACIDIRQLRNTARITEV